MRNQNTFGTTVVPRQNKNKAKHHTIYCRISVNDTDEKEFSMKGIFDVNNWDEGKGWPRLHIPELRAFATHLEKVKAKLC